MALPLELGVSVGFLYLVCFISVFLLSSYSLCKQLDKWNSVASFFQHFLLFFLFFRIGWLVVLLLDDTGLTDFVLNRLAMLAFFTAFSIILYSWIDALAASRLSSPKVLTNIWRIFLFLNVVLYTLFIASLIMYIKSPSYSQHRESDPFYNANILLIAGINFLGSLMFFVYGIRLYIQARSISHNQNNRSTLKIVLVTSLIVLCFCLRFALFLYRPVSGRILPVGIFCSLGYYVPEIVPVSVQILLYYLRLVERIKAQEREKSEPLLDQQFIFDDNVAVQRLSHYRYSFSKQHPSDSHSHTLDTPSPASLAVQYTERVSTSFHHEYD